MKAHRILGILWFALCCFTCFNMLRSFPTIQPVAPFVWFVLVSYCLLNLAGVVASMFLFRGALWTRWILCLLAIFMAFVGIASIVTSGSLSIWNGVVCVFALVSPILLFLPRHEPV